MTKQLEDSLEAYLKHEQGVDLSTLSYFIKNFKNTKLLHSPRHPSLCLLTSMCDMITNALGVDKIEFDATAFIYDFNFCQWPLITRHHTYFSFPEQAYFIIAGQQFSIEDVAAAYYRFYNHNPQIAEASKHCIIDL